MPGTVVLPGYLAPSCTFVPLRLREVAVGFALEEGIVVDGRSGWQQRWVWRLVDVTARTDSRPSTLESVAEVLAELLGGGCTPSQVVSFTGCHWPATILEHDGLDGMMAACQGLGWTLWPHPIDPATPSSPYIWRVSTCLDGCRVAAGEDEFVMRKAGVERVPVANLATIHRFDGVENRTGTAVSEGWEVCDCRGFDPDSQQDRANLLELLRRWIPLSEIADVIDLGPVVAPGDEVFGVDDEQEVIFEAPDNSDTRIVRCFAITRTESGWQISVLDAGEYWELHRWSAADNSEAVGRNVSVSWESTTTIADAVESALRCGAALGDVFTFTGDVWPAVGYPDMLASFADGCTGDGWCPWPLPPRDEDSGIAGMWLTSVVDGNRHTVESVERVIQLGGVRGVEVPMESRSMLFSTMSSLPGLAARAHILDGFRCEAAEHWSELLHAVRARTLAEPPFGVTDCGGFIAFAVDDV